MAEVKLTPEAISEATNLVLRGVTTTGSRNPDFLADLTGLPVDFVQDVISAVSLTSLWSDKQKDLMFSLLEAVVDESFIEP
jgi:hypothetical protein